MLRVVGQSMLRAGIEEGDLLVVEEDDSPPDGTIVVALVEGGEEAMVKRLYREGELVRLRSENDAYEDIILPSEAVLIQGRVLYVIHPPRL
jgi:repressor LexA